jgi:hypothetical protein
LKCADVEQEDFVEVIIDESVEAPVIATTVLGIGRIESVLSGAKLSDYFVSDFLCLRKITALHLGHYELGQPGSLLLSGFSDKVW